MKKLLLSLFLILSTFTFTMPKTEFKVIESKNTLDSKNLLLDINSCSLEEMQRVGISKSYGDRIIKYREITGGFQKLSDLKKLSGIGEKTYEKLKVYFLEPQGVELKEFNINEVDDKVLAYYGLNKKEIKKIRLHQKKSPIRNSYELKELLPSKKYDKLKDIVRY